MEKQLIIILIITTLVISGCTKVVQKNTNDTPSNSQETTELDCDKKCPEDHTLYHITDCGLGPDGAIPCPPEIKAQEDCLCHKRCWENGDKDCPRDMPVCKTTCWSDFCEDLCFKE